MSKTTSLHAALDFSLDALFEWVRQTRQVDLCSYDSDFALRQICQRLEELSLGALSDYLSFLKNDPNEVERLITRMGVGYTRFFRNALVFETLRCRILPSLLQERPLLKRDGLRLWSAGCATGEEPYSLAILILELMRCDPSLSPARIFATDIDETMLEQARRGVYSPSRLASTRLAWVERYFLAEEREFRVREEVKSLVDFSCEDLARKSTLAPAASIFGEFELILCRNILIYLKPAQQTKIIQKLSRALAPGGYLVLGRTEEIPEPVPPLLHVISPDLRIYRRT